MIAYDKWIPVGTIYRKARSVLIFIIIQTIKKLRAWYIAQSEPWGSPLPPLPGGEKKKKEKEKVIKESRLKLHLSLVLWASKFSLHLNYIKNILSREANSTGPKSWSLKTKWLEFIASFHLICPSPSCTAQQDLFRGQREQCSCELHKAKARAAYYETLWG